MQPRPYIIDVREPQEFNESHVTGAINIPLGNIANISTLLAAANFDDQLIVYCQSGARAASACRNIAALGYTNVVNGINQKIVEANYL